MKSITVDNDYEIVVHNDDGTEVWGPYKTERICSEIALAFVRDQATVTIRPVSGVPFTGQPF